MAMVTAVLWSMAGALSGGVLARESEPDPDIANRMPGLGSFIVFAFLAVALYFLLKNMNARLRRMSYREREREAQEAAEQAGEQERAADTVDEADPDTGGPATGGRDTDGRDTDGPATDERG